MNNTFARDYLKQHIVDGQPLSALELALIVEAGVADFVEFEERLPHQWFHNSHEPFPDGWTQADQDEVSDGLSSR